MKDIADDFLPEDGLIRLPNFVLQDLIDKGFSYLTLPDGRCIKITKDDLLFKKEEIDAYMENLEKNK